MMLHRHFEEDKKIDELTRMENLDASPDTTDPNDPLYVPVEPEDKPRRGRPPKEVKHEAD